MRLRCLAAGAAGALALVVAFALPASAALLIRIDKAAQKMTIVADGETLYVWPVSTGLANYDTPNGAFQPFRMERDYFSREWDNAPMPNSIFFTMKGHAIHGTYNKGLGNPASRGCVRLSVQNSAMLWALVRRHKMANTSVVISGVIPEPEPAVASAKPAEARAEPAVVRAEPADAPRVRAGNGRDDEDVTGAVPLSERDRRRIEREARRWREVREGERHTYYDRGRRDYERAPPPRRIYDRYGGWVYASPPQFPLGLFGR